MDEVCDAIKNNVIAKYPNNIFRTKIIHIQLDVYCLKYLLNVYGYDIWIDLSRIRVFKYSIEPFFHPKLR